MKQIIISLDCDEFEKQAVLNCVQNKLKIDMLYDDVFRKHIRYEEDQETTWEKVWDELREYLEE